jgi:hypothetical protein
MQNHSDNPTPYDTYMKHSSFTAPMPLAQLALDLIGEKGTVQSAKWVQTDIKAYMDFETDLVLEIEILTALGKILLKRLHIEFQRTFVAGYKFNMLCYRALLMKKYQTEDIISVVIYCGDNPCTMDFDFTDPSLQFRCHVIDLNVADVAPILTSDSIYIRLFAIFNQTLQEEELAHQIALAMANYHQQHPEFDFNPFLDQVLSICSTAKESLYMEIKSLISTMGLPGFDYEQSFAYIKGDKNGEAKGEAKGRVKDALKLMEKKGWSIDEVVDVLELNAAELEALQQALRSGNVK